MVLNPTYLPSLILVVLPVLKVDLEGIQDSVNLNRRYLVMGEESWERDEDGKRDKKKGGRVCSFYMILKLQWEWK